MLTYGWRYCPLCKGETHHTINGKMIICNACHTEDELKDLIEQKVKEVGEVRSWAS